MSLKIPSALRGRFELRQIVNAILDGRRVVA